LEKVRRVLIDVPGDPRLVSLESRIQRRIEHMSTEDARAAILLQVREVLKQRKFARAVEILEQCKPPILTPEIGELLDYARQESRHEELQRLVARSYDEAQTLLREERYEDLVRLLGPIAQASNDPRLRSLLDQAQRVIEERNAEQAKAVDRLRPLADATCYEQVVSLIQSLPGVVSNSPEIRAIYRASETAWTQEWTGLELLGRAYAALESRDWDAIKLDSDGLDGLTSLRQMRDALSGRRRTTVDQILVSQAKHIQEVKAAGGQMDPSRQLADNRRLLPFASDAVKAEWSLLADQYSESKMGKLLARFGKRR
jgi:hypothetical protein